MPQKSTARTPKKKREEKAAKVKKLLAGPSRWEDSDEEDQEWEWVYASEVKGNEDVEENEDGDAQTPRKRRRKTATQVADNAIVGARTSSLDIRIGDTVLLDPETSGTVVWVALILNFFEDAEKGKSATFMCKRIETV